MKKIQQIFIVTCLIIIQFTISNAYTALDAQSYEQCWQNLFKNASLCPVVVECMQDSECQTALLQDYVCSIDCNKINFTGPGDLMFQASDPKCGHACDASFVPENYTAKGKYFAVLVCYNQCYDILQPKLPTYTVQQAQQYESCWRQMFSKNTTCQAIPQCMADKYCSMAAGQLYQCSLNCDFLNFTGPNNEKAIAVDPQCAHSCDAESAPTNNFNSHALYWSVIDCCSQCYELLESPQPQYYANQAISYNNCWKTLFSNYTTCLALKPCMSNNLCKKALNNDYNCSIACNKVTYQGGGFFVVEASDPLCGHSCDQQNAPTDPTALELWNNVMQCYQGCYKYLSPPTPKQN